MINKKNRSNILTKISIFLLSLILIQLALAIPEFKTSDEYVITVTNSSQAITGAVVDYEIFFVDNRSSVVNGVLAEWQDGDYYLQLDNLTEKDETYLIHLNITYGSNEIHLTDYFKIVPTFIQEDLQTIDDYVDSVESNQAVIDGYLSTNYTANYVWNHSVRTPTTSPTTDAVFSFDITQSGDLNLSVFDNVEPVYFFNASTPTNSIPTRTYYNQKTFFLLDAVRPNITSLFLKPWLSYTGSPTTDNLEIWIESVNVLNLSTANLSTSMTQYLFEVTPPTFNDEWIEVEFVGFADHSPGNEFTIGYGDNPSSQSLESSDGGSTYEDTTFENALGLIISYNQLSIADTINQETSNFNTATAKAGCPGEIVPIAYAFNDFKGQPHNINSFDISCAIKLRNKNGSISAFAESDDVPISKSGDGEKLLVTWNNTGSALANETYGIMCNGTILYNGHTENHTFHSVETVKFNRDCDVQSNFTTIVNDSTFGLQSIKDYLVNVIKDAIDSVSSGSGEETAAYVWNYSIGYNATDGTYPMDANETLRIIAENTEYGGW